MQYFASNKNVVWCELSLRMREDCCSASRLSAASASLNFLSVSRQLAERAHSSRAIYQFRPNIGHRPFAIVIFSTPRSRCNPIVGAGGCDGLATKR